MAMVGEPVILSIIISNKLNVNSATVPTTPAVIQHTAGFLNKQREHRESTCSSYRLECFYPKVL